MCKWSCAPLHRYSIFCRTSIQEEDEAEVKQVQTLFTVKLEKFDESKKIALIKEVKKSLEGMNLVQVRCAICFLFDVECR